MKFKCDSLEEYEGAVDSYQFSYNIKYPILDGDYPEKYPCVVCFSNYEDSHSRSHIETAIVYLSDFE